MAELTTLTLRVACDALARREPTMYEAPTKQVPRPHFRVAVIYILRAGPSKGVDGKIKASSTWNANQAGHGG